MRKPIDQKLFDEFLELSPEHYQMIMRSVRPSDMEYDKYKQHMRTYKKLVKIQREGYAQKKDMPIDPT